MNIDELQRALVRRSGPKKDSVDTLYVKDVSKESHKPVELREKGKYVLSVLWERLFQGLPSQV